MVLAFSLNLMNLLDARFAPSRHHLLQVVEAIDPYYWWTCASQDDGIAVWLLVSCPPGRGCYWATSRSAILRNGLGTCEFRDKSKDRKAP